MKPKQKVILICSIQLFLCLMDGLLTYINTPDLKMEGNPLVSVLGLGWTALFLANAILFVIYIFCAYYHFMGYQPPKLKVNNFKEYISMLYYGRPDKFSWFFYKFSREWKVMLAYLSYILIYAAPVARSILVFEWLMITFGVEWKLYDRIRNVIPYGRMDLAVYIIIFLPLSYWWLLKQYRLNQVKEEDC